MTRDDDLERLAAEHALGLLEGEEAARAERMLASDQTFAAAVAYWRSRFTELDQTALAARPSEALWRRIESGLAQTATSQVPTTPLIVPDPRNAFRALWHNLAFWRFSGLATALAQIVAEELDVDVARVTMVLGSTTCAPNQGPTIASASIQNHAAPLRTDPAGALIARIENGAPMLVGNQRTFTANQSGRLYFSVNDDFVADNVGAYRVSVSVNR